MRERERKRDERDIISCKQTGSQAGRVVDVVTNNSTTEEAHN